MTTTTPTPATGTAPESQPAFFTEERHSRIIRHMNEDHADVNLNYVHHFASLPAATAAALTDIDRDGIYLDVTLTDKTLRPVFIAFDAPLASESEAHHKLMAMANAAAPASSRRSPEDALQRAREGAAWLRENVKTVILSTYSMDGIPDASVAPVVFENGEFYIYISGLSTHTGNIRATGHAGVLLIEDESSARQLLARRRLSFPCTATLVPRDTPAFEKQMTAIIQKFGPVMEHLAGMTDFQLFRLTPGRGRLVTGFGKAYDVSPADWTDIRHVADKGHTVERKA